MTWTTLITTSDYAEGVICLAISLVLVKSRANLLCYVTTEYIKEVIILKSLQQPGYILSNLIIEIVPSFLYDDVFCVDISRDPSSFIDAPRRFLFKLGKPFIFLDADMIALQNFDELLDKIDDDIDNDGFIYAVPNFRNKKKAYGSTSGNFNAGLMIVPRPLLSDYNMAINMLMNNYNDTEEKLLNEVFRNRWKGLSIGYNCQKRSYKLAPKIWNEIKESKLGIKIIHFVGGKPWQSAETIKRLDWEGYSEESMAPYHKLFELWHLIYDNKITINEADINNSIAKYIPLA